MRSAAALPGRQADGMGLLQRRAAGALHAGRQLQDQERLHHGVGDAAAPFPPAVRADRPQGHRQRSRAAGPQRPHQATRRKIIKALQETMPSKTTEEWIAILRPKDVFCERVNNYTIYLEHPHVKESGRDRLDRSRGRRGPPAGRQHPRPAAGQPSTRRSSTRPVSARDGADILGELGYGSATEADAIFTRGGVRRADTGARRRSNPSRRLRRSPLGRPHGLLGHLKPMGEGIAVVDQDGVDAVLARPSRRSRARWRRGCRPWPAPRRGRRTTSR